MAFGAIQHRALDLAAAALMQNVDIRVRRETAGLPLAQLYSDRDGVTPLTNPTAAGHFADGKILAYAIGGSYRVELLVDGNPVDEFFNIAVGTAPEIDADAVF